MLIELLLKAMEKQILCALKKLKLAMRKIDVLNLNYQDN